MRALPLGNQGLANAGLALRTGPYSSAAPVKASAGRGSDADRSRCLQPLPSLPPQKPATDGRAKEPSREREERREKETRARWALLWHCFGVCLIFLSFFPSCFFLHCPFLWTWTIYSKYIGNLLPFCFFYFCLDSQGWHLQRRAPNW